MYYCAFDKVCLNCLGYKMSTFQSSFIFNVGIKQMQVEEFFLGNICIEIQQQ